MVKIKKKVALEPKAFLVHLLKKEETEVELDGYIFNYNEEHYSFDPEIKTNEFISYSLHSNTFTVEIEEEITEETKLPKFLVVFLNMSISNYIERSLIEENQSIKEILQENKNCSLITKAIHLINDDRTHTLIWKDGELVGDE
ncbi:hypothetical protein [Staphylococcus hominis]|uniref:hypothetical protein n=1 Tax=Staphylococcus hominis TaxID=1290 RepID=UPI000F202904|nr:hypothetical protein [Staphylococcus hominis]QIY36441.1 hypothetical protein FOC53_02620 [Staphylococcus hominis]RLY87908.1 hypothetical protein D9V10_02630 [Staphylococcus hominis]